MARPGFLAHPKFKRCVAVLRVPRALFLGHVELLWMSAYETGDPCIGDEIAVEAVAEWEGECGAFARAMHECVLLDLVDGKYEIHDFFDHAPRYVTDRASREAERRRKGQTMSAIRSAAGKKGAAVKHERAAKQTSGKRMANGGHLLPDDGKRMANGDYLPTEDGKCVANGDHLPENPGNCVANGATPNTQHPLSPTERVAADAANALTEKTKKGKRQTSTKPRERNPLFDAIVEITGEDPHVNGSHIGKVAALLAGANPPYTPEEVRRLPAAIKAAGLPEFTLTVGAVQNHISRVRQQASPGSAPVETDAERLRRLQEETDRRFGSSGAKGGKV